MKTRSKQRDHTGSTFDGFLEQERILEQIERSRSIASSRGYEQQKSTGRQQSQFTRRSEPSIFTRSGYNLNRGTVYSRTEVL